MVKGDYIFVLQKTLSFKEYDDPIGKYSPE